MDAIRIMYNDFGPKHRKNQKMLTQRPKNHDIFHESAIHTSEELKSPIFQSLSVSEGFCEPHSVKHW